ncbi:MAG: adenylate/guanylate cyclase domain-containing protein [Desulfobacterales bacterium]|nr:adenylate/guanylate cyclase domain-containing protein [Desulfobacterales bacterium]
MGSGLFGNKILKVFRINAATVTVGIIVMGMAAYLWGVPFLELMELKTVDLRFISRGVVAPGPDVILAVVDEKSLEEQGKWIWPRSKFAKLVQILSESNAKVIAFDVGFLEPDKNSTVRAAADFEDVVKDLGIREEKLDAYLMQVRQQADNDLIFAQAVRESKAKVVLGYFFQMTREGLEHVGEKIIKAQIKNARTSRYSMIRYTSDKAQSVPLQEAFMPQSNIATIAGSTRYSGYFNMFPDRDGGVRWVPLLVRCGEHFYAPLSVQAIRAYTGRAPTVAIADYGVQGIRLGKLAMPTNELGRLMVNYRGGAKTFPHISITDILHHRVSPETFKDKIVLVGATAIGIYDMRVTPFSSVFPGLEIHANIIDNILRQDFLQRPNWAAIFDLIAMALLGLIVGLAIPRLRALPGTAVTIGLLVTYILLCQYLFTHLGAWLNIVYPAAVLVLTYVSLTLYKYLTEERDKRFLQATFASYLAPELIEEMFNSKTMPELGGEARIVTAYFTDIQGFSTFSEILTAHQLVELLNEYLSAMTDILISEKGTLDKYEGDAIIAFFGAPMDLADHGLRACRVAVAMQNKLLELREKWRNEKQLPDEPNRNTKNLPPEEWVPGDKWPKIVHQMKMRIGINSGEIVVGNMGSSMRMNYTMMGDPVNLAARLEAAGKQYGVYTFASEYTMDFEFIDENSARKKVMDMVEARMIDNITVVGKSEPVKVYEICAMKGGLAAQEKDLLKGFDEGMQHYLRMEWDEAVAKFNESLKIEQIFDGKTTPSEVYIQRCKRFKENPPAAPGEEWDGVFRLTEK